MKLIGIIVLSVAIGVDFWTAVANATPGKSNAANDLLVRFVDASAMHSYSFVAQTNGTKMEDLGGGNWVRMQFKNQQLRESSIQSLLADPRVLHAQPNYKIRLLEDYRIHDAKLKALVARDRANARKSSNSNLLGNPYPDNPAFSVKGPPTMGPDPKISSQWGMLDIGISSAWKHSRGEGLIVAIIDSGIDYTHDDLVDNLWRNPGEIGMDNEGRDKSINGIDDDGNGFVDDLIGWDFVSNDNKPYDFAVNPIDLLGGGNPGHGTHCAGNVAAVADNAVGVTGVAPSAKIMGLRFISEKGTGDTAGAVKSINYAVKMGAKILNNSWGSEGEDPKETEANKALRDTITNAMTQGVLFVAAAGNGHSGVGYDNDTDPKPAYPASYDIDNIVSVAALDKQDNLGGFSNWGKRSVDIGAPGVVVFSTTIGSKFSDVVLDLPQYGILVTWDGTSMAAPHVAGAAALFWAKHPNATWRDVKNALLSSAKPVAALTDKSVSGGKLNVEKLMQQ
jgi:subtilisin family serine protease